MHDGIYEANGYMFRRRVRRRVLIAKGGLRLQTRELELINGRYERNIICVDMKICRKKKPGRRCVPKKEKKEEKERRMKLREKSILE